MNIFFKLTSFLLVVLLIADVFGVRADAKHRKKSKDLIDPYNLKADMKKKEPEKEKSEEEEKERREEFEKIKKRKKNLHKKKKKNHKKTVHCAPTHHKTIYHNRTNLKLVFRKVLPPGVNRSKNNVVFEFNDYEEGKKCRCVCRMR